ncbi:MAG: DUF5076 domain-containing protein [Rhodobacteraceae bacterium]|nr:DUF5076 domain-containing protein [Paracoccaceae bacterium]
MFWKKKQDGQLNIQDPMLVAVKEESKERTLALHIDCEQLGMPGEAGVMLADIAREMAKSFDRTYADVTETEALAEITRVFDAELRTPTEGRAHSMNQ